MSAPVLTERKPSSGASISVDGGRYQRVFDVLAASEADALAIVLAQKGVQRGVVYVSPYGETPDPLAKCQSITVTVETPAPLDGNGTGRYIVTADYARRAGKGKGGSSRKQPEPGKPAVWYIEATEISVPVDHDVNGIPITNATDEPIDPPLTKTDTDEVLVCEFYAESTDELSLYGLYRPYRNKVNSVIFRGIEKGCAKFNGVEIRPEEDGLYLVKGRWHIAQSKSLPGVSQYIRRVVSAGNSFVSVSAPIEGWADVKIHRGRRKLVDANQTDPEKRYGPILDNDQRPVSEPVMLNPSGTVRTSDQGPIALVTYHYPYIDFSTMPIP